MSEKSTIELARASAWTDRVRAYQVWVDREKVGTIKNGKTESFIVTSGQHEVTVSIDWAGSPSLMVDMPTGGTVKLTCRPRANPLTGLYYSLFARKKYLRLDFAS